MCTAFEKMLQELQVEGTIGLKGALAGVMSASRSTLTVVNVRKGRGCWGNRMKGGLVKGLGEERQVGSQKAGCQESFAYLRIFRGACANPKPRERQRLSRLENLLWP